VAPEALEQIENLSTSSLGAFHTGPQNSRVDIYWISSTIIGDVRRELAP